MDLWINENLTCKFVYSDGILLKTVTPSVHCTISDMYVQIHILSLS
jgi:hypothetical protein